MIWVGVLVFFKEPGGRKKFQCLCLRCTDTVVYYAGALGGTRKRVPLLTIFVAL